MILHHFMSRAQLEALKQVVAKPVEHHGNIDWIFPAWWYLAYSFAKS